MLRSARRRRPRRAAGTGARSAVSVHAEVCGLSTVSDGQATGWRMPMALPGGSGLAGVAEFFGRPSRKIAVSSARSAK
jgi:hypothetical protein